MVHPSPWLASAGTVGILLAVGAVFGVVIRAESGDPFGLVAGPLIALPLVLAELRAAFALSGLLREFASQVPGEPEAETSLLGDQRLDWPRLGLSVSGSTHRFQVQRSRVEFDGEEGMAVPATRPREVAREALDRLDREPAFATRADRFPSIAPGRAGVWTGVIATVVVVFAVLAFGVAVGPDAFPPVVLGVVVLGPLAGLVRWAGLVSVRTALGGLVDGLEAEGVPLERIDRLEGGFRPAYAVRTSQGTVTVRCLALPRGRLSVSHIDREREARLSLAEDVGREIAELLTGRRVMERSRRLE
jgi:hypothetical protein